MKKSAWRTHLCLYRSAGVAQLVHQQVRQVRFTDASSSLFPRLSFVCDCRVHVGLLAAVLTVAAGVVPHVVAAGVMRNWSVRRWWSEVCDSRAERVGTAKWQ